MNNSGEFGDKSELKEKKEGLILALTCYLFWGLSPFYWKMLAGVNAFEILLHRVFWALIFSYALLLIRGESGEFIEAVKKMIRERKPFIKMVTASIFVMTNWGLYIYCVSSNRMLDAALAYYINPLISIVLGFIFLKEKMSKFDFAAVLIAFSGVMLILFYSGKLPIMSLALAFSFGLYGLLKKNVGLKVTHSMLFESLVLMPFVIPCLAYFHLSGMGSFNLNATGLLLIIAGPVTALPLYLFAMALKKIDLSTMGFMQFTNPTIVFLISIFVYKEVLSSYYLYAFLLIWTGIFTYIYSHFIRKKR